MEQKHSSTLKKFLISGFVLALLAGGVWSCSGIGRGPIYAYEEQRDFPAMLDLFERNLYWLTPYPDSSNFKFYMKYKTHSYNPLDFGKMKIKVLRERNQLVGFITYYMDTPTIGDILFLVVDEQFRGKRYGQKLLEYAINDLVSMGAQTIELVTRPENKAGHKLYERVGFYETGRNHIHTYHRYNVK